MHALAVFRKPAVMKSSTFFVLLTLACGVCCASDNQWTNDDPAQEPRARPELVWARQPNTLPTATSQPSFGKLKEYFEIRSKSGPQITNLITRVSQRNRRPGPHWRRTQRNRAIARQRATNFQHAERAHRGSHHISSSKPNPKLSLGHASQPFYVANQHSASADQSHIFALDQSRSVPSPGDDNGIDVRINAKKIPRQSNRRWVRLRPRLPHFMQPNNIAVYPRYWIPSVPNNQARSNPASGTAEALAMLTQRLSKMEASMARLKEAIDHQGTAHILGFEKMEAILTAQIEQATENRKETYDILMDLKNCCAYSLQTGSSSSQETVEDVISANEPNSQRHKSDSVVDVIFEEGNNSEFNKDRIEDQKSDAHSVEDNNFQEIDFEEGIGVDIRENDPNEPLVGHDDVEHDSVLHGGSYTERPDGASTPQFRDYTIRNESDPEDHVVEVIEEYDWSEEQQPDVDTSPQFKRYININRTDSDGNVTEVIQEFDWSEKQEHSNVTAPQFKEYTIVNKTDSVGNIMEVIQNHERNDGQQTNSVIPPQFKEHTIINKTSDGNITEVLQMNNSSEEQQPNDVRTLQFKHYTILNKSDYEGNITEVVQVNNRSEQRQSDSERTLEFKHYTIINKTDAEGNITEVLQVNNRSEEQRSDSVRTLQFKHYTIINKTDAEGNITEVLQVNNRSEEQRSDSVRTLQFKHYTIINKTDAEGNITEVLQVNNGSEEQQSDSVRTLQFKQYPIMNDTDFDDNTVEVIQEYDWSGEQELYQEHDGGNEQEKTSTEEIPTTEMFKTSTVPLLTTGFYGFAAAYRPRSDGLLVSSNGHSSFRSQVSEQSDSEGDTKSAQDSGKAEHDALPEGDSSVYGLKESIMSVQDGANMENKDEELHTNPTFLTGSKQNRIFFHDASKTTAVHQENMINADKSRGHHSTIGVKQSDAEPMPGMVELDKASTVSEEIPSHSASTAQPSWHRIDGNSSKSKSTPDVSYQNGAHSSGMDVSVTEEFVFKDFAEEQEHRTDSKILIGRKDRVFSEVTNEFSLVDSKSEATSTLLGLLTTTKSIPEYVTTTDLPSTKIMTTSKAEDSHQQPHHHHQQHYHRHLEVDFQTGVIRDDGMSGVEWVVRPSRPDARRQRRSPWLSWLRSSPSPGASDCAMQGVLKFTFTPPPASSARTRSQRLRRRQRHQRHHRGGNGKEEEEEDGEGERRKLMLNLEIRRPKQWVFNLGDSVANNGYSGDGSVQQNDCEAQGHGTSFAVYASDKHPRGRRKLLHVRNDFLRDNVTLIVSDQTLSWNNHHGDEHTLTHASLFALSGQTDSQGDVNYDVYLGLNRVIDGNYRSGYGLCRLSAQWLK